MLHTLIRGPEIKHYETPNGFFVSKMFSSVSTNDNVVYRQLIQNGYSHQHTPVYHHYTPTLPTPSAPPLPTPSAPPLPTPSAPPLPTPSATSSTSPTPKQNKTSTPVRYGATLEEIQAQKQKIQNFECPEGTKRQGLRCIPASEFLAKMAKN